MATEHAMRTNDSPRWTAVRLIAESRPDYRPWCSRCGFSRRMEIVSRFYWRCPCGGVHDERDITSESPTALPVANTTAAGGGEAVATDAEGG